MRTARLTIEDVAVRSHAHESVGAIVRDVRGAVELARANVLADVVAYLNAWGITGSDPGLVAALQRGEHARARSARGDSVSGRLDGIERRMRALVERRG